MLYISGLLFIAKIGKHKEKQQIDLIPNEIVDLNFLKDNFNLKYHAYSESLEHVLNIDFFLS